MPASRKIHKGPVPRLGGMAMATGAVLAPIMWTTLDAQMVGFLCGVAIILTFGVWDDIKGIDYHLKFLGQIIAVLILVLHGGVVNRYAPFPGVDPLPDYVALAVTGFPPGGVPKCINFGRCVGGFAGRLP